MNSYKTTSKCIRYNLQKLSKLVFEVTDKCNLNCKYCIYSKLYRENNTREGKNISFMRAKVIIDYLYNLWKDDYSDGSDSELVIGFYGGEPLMNISFIKQTIDYLESIKLEKIGRKYSYSMTTNAVLLDQYMDYLVEKGFSLLISLDGDEIAQSYRIDHLGKNSFERVFRNVKLLQEKYPKHFEKKVGFNSVLHNRNEVESIYQFIYTKFGKIPMISPLNKTGVCVEKKDEFIKLYRNPMESFYHSSNCELIESEMFMRAPRVAGFADYILYQSGNNFQTYNDLYVNKDNIPLSTGTCLPFAKKMFITVDGKILPCERIGQQLSLGHVYEDRVELNEEYVADSHNYYVSKYVKQCINCATNMFCVQCIYQIDDICKEDTRCPIFRSKKELEKRNDDIFKFLEKHPQYYRRVLKEVKISR
ncbi:MAG: radical SAM peptide maturase [Lentimicrobiaceae bacterium]|nr:radical SAM peptide maturase [Lentimicrobiaceae bacterium]